MMMLNDQVTTLYDFDKKKDDKDSNKKVLNGDDPAVTKMLIARQNGRRN